LVVIEPVLMKARKELSGGRKRGKGDFMPVFPPLPLESDLFTPPVGERNVRKADLKVLAEAVVSMMPIAHGGEVCGGGGQDGQGVGDEKGQGLCYL
jgi:hypothetical protein